jgi:hypothetical protein
MRAEQTTVDKRIFQSKVVVQMEYLAVYVVKKMFLSSEKGYYHMGTPRKSPVAVENGIFPMIRN